jgi:membrane-associated protease RseP (regulator of RpoE activity)
MKGRWLAGILACAMILLAVAAVAPAKGDKSDTDAHAWLGIQLQDVTRDVSRAMNLQTDHGALIAQVQDGSPADQAGLKEGDVITKFDGKTIHNASDLTDRIRDENPGDEVPITIERDGGEMKLNVRLGDSSNRMPNRYGAGGNDEESGAPEYQQGESDTRGEQYGENQQSEEPHEYGQQPYGQPYGQQYRPQGQGNQQLRLRQPRAFLGVQLEGLTDQLGDFFGVQNGQGALIATVVDGSPAEQAGLKAGDVITKIGDQEVTDPSDITRAVHQANPGDSVNITYLSDQGHNENTVTVQLTRPPAGQSAFMMDRAMNMEPGTRGMAGMGMGRGMQNWQNWQGNRQWGTYGSGEPTVEDTQEHFQQMHEQIEQLEREIQELREQIQSQGMGNR